MGFQRRNQSSRRMGPPQPDFCPRCGGVMGAPQGGATHNRCRCSDQQREAYRGGRPAAAAVKAGATAGGSEVKASSTDAAAGGEAKDSSNDSAPPERSGGSPPQDAEREQDRQMEQGQETPG